MGSNKLLIRYNDKWPNADMYGAPRSVIESLPSSNHLAKHAYGLDRANACTKHLFQDVPPRYHDRSVSRGRREAG